MRLPEIADGQRLARLAREAITEALRGRPLHQPEGLPGVPGASFVTLTLEGALRGCMGSVLPQPSLEAGVMDHARAAAFHDSRFDPLTRADLPRLTVEVSVLSPLRPLAVADEADLRRHLRPGVDGLLLELDGRQATFLPQVWEDLPDPTAFLTALKRKARWPAGAWPLRAQAWCYTVEAWRDEPRPAPPSAGVLLGTEGHRYLHPARHWHRLGDGRLRCDLCPHACALGDGQPGRCLVRRRSGSRLVLAAYGATSGFCVDPVEKKPLYHFLPGARVLSFGAVGCSLDCRFCQNWNLSQARDLRLLRAQATPNAVARSALHLGCQAVAFTYNEPTILLEWVTDVAEACHAEGLATVAVTSGYLGGAARQDFFAHIDAANVDLKAFSDTFYRRVCGGSLQPVLDTLRYLVHDTGVWTEITTLLIPGLNDSDQELRQLSGWIADELGPEVPLHFSAFHPDHRMLDRPATPIATLRRARDLAMEAGLRYVYTGNVCDLEGETTFCSGCRAPVLQREGYLPLGRSLDGEGRCRHCGTRLPGRFLNPTPMPVLHPSDAVS